MSEYLLVTSPDRKKYQGGLFLIADNGIYALDYNSSLGLSFSSGILTRGVYPNKLQVYTKEGIALEKKDVSFADIHDVLFFKEHYYVVATELNAILKIDSAGMEVQRWSLGEARDSRHVNCLAIIDDRVVYSAFGNFTKSRGYKGDTKNNGFVNDLITNQTIVCGLSQPHTPTPFGSNLLIANSENFELQEYTTSGSLLRSKKMAGYTRGICVTKDYVYVGISKIREISSSDIDSAYVCILNKNTWEEERRVSVPVEEIYALAVIEDKDYLISLLSELINESVVDSRSIVIKLNSKPWVVNWFNKTYHSAAKRLNRWLN